MQYGEKTVPYKTYLKTAMVEGLTPVLQQHPDQILRQGARATVEFPTDEQDYPCVVIKFFEREIRNGGVAHQEIIDFQQAKHYLYHGDIEFDVQARSSVDRDLMADLLVQTLAMGDLQDYTNNFFLRLYDDGTKWPLAKHNFININTDTIRPGGETTSPAPWDPNPDTMIYLTSYRTQVFGEFYSLLNTPQTTTIEHINVYPYLDGVEPVPVGDNPSDPAKWIP